jgi:hypothetical protein
VQRRHLIIAAVAASLVASTGGHLTAQDTSAARARAPRPAPVKVILTIDGGASPSDAGLLEDVDLGLGRAFALDSTVAFNSPGRTGEIVTTAADEAYIDVRVWITRRFGTGPYTSTLDWRAEMSVPGVHPMTGSTPRGGSGDAAAQRTVADIARAVRSMAATLRE